MNQKVEIGNALRFENLLKEAVLAHRVGRQDRAAQLVDEARAMLPAVTDNDSDQRGA